MGFACLATIIASAVFNDPATPPATVAVVVFAVDAIAEADPFFCCSEAVVNGTDATIFLEETLLFEHSPVVCGVVIDVEVFETEDVDEPVDDTAVFFKVADDSPPEIETTEAEIEDAGVEPEVTWLLPNPIDKGEDD